MQFFSLQSVPKCKELAYEILERVENAGKVQKSAREVQETQNTEKYHLKYEPEKKIRFVACDFSSNDKSVVPLHRGQTRISFCD